MKTLIKKALVLLSLILSTQFATAAEADLSTFKAFGEKSGFGV